MGTATKSDSRSHARWGNQNNAAFYDRIPADALTRQAEKAGIAGGEDFAQILPFLRQLPLDSHSRILEVGAGTGRLVAELRRHLPEVQVVALERSARNLTELTRRFRGDRKVTLLDRNLLEAPAIKSCHVALWFFSGITEFHPEERPRALAKVREMVSPNGLLFLEMTAKISPRVSTSEAADGSVDVHYDDATIRIHMASPEAVEEDAREAGWDPVGVLDYESATGLPRVILVLQRRK